jgi:hypothetical protein
MKLIMENWNKYLEKETIHEDENLTLKHVKQGLKLTSSRAEREWERLSKLPRSQYPDDLKKHLGIPLDEGLANKIAMGAALIASMVGGAPDANAAIQVSQDTIEDAGKLPIANAANLLTDTTARVIYGGLVALDPVKFPGAKEAAKIFAKAHKSRDIQQFENMPPLAQKALQVIVTQMHDAKASGDDEKVRQTVNQYRDFEKEAPKRMKLKRKFRD